MIGLSSARVARTVILTAAAFTATPAGAQPPDAPPAPTAREQAEAHFDLTGYWVPVITEDWLLRMVTPPIGYVGQYEKIPLNAEAMEIAMAWDPQADRSMGLECKAFGVGNIMRMPTRLHISWENDETLRIDTDYGEQTRLLRFDDGRGSMPQSGPTWQGNSRASWVKQRQGRGFGPGPRGGPGRLVVVTDGMRAGYLTRHGFPYSENATVTEYFVRHDDFGDEWFTVTTVIEDPTHLTEPYVTSTHFRREPDDDGWNPRPCEIVPPVRP